MHIVDSYYVKIRYTYTNFFHMFFKSSVGFMLSNCVNEKIFIYFHMFLKSFVGFVLSNYLNAKKNIFGMQNTQYSIVLSVHKQPGVFNTTYAIQSRVNCPNITQRCLSVYTTIFVWRKNKTNYLSNQT